MLAVKRDRSFLVTLFTSLPLSDTVYLSRDTSASTALHAAAQHAYAPLARILASTGPTELLHIENGVGQTAAEVAGLRLLNAWAEVQSGLLPPVKWDLPVDWQKGLDQLKLPHLIKGMRQRVKELRQELAALLHNGKIGRTTEPGRSLLGFADAMEAKLASSLPSSDGEEKGRPVDENASQTRTAAEETYWVLFDAARARAAKRRLVHVLDVQQSVEHSVKQAALERAEENATYTRHYGQERTIDEQLKGASIFQDPAMMFRGRRAMRECGAIDWFVDADEIY